MDIQLKIPSPELIGAKGQADRLSVTFWGTRFFKNTDLHEVRYGTELVTPIFR